MAELTATIRAKFDDITGIADEIKELQIYEVVSFPDGKKTICVSLPDVVEVLARHIETRCE